MQCVNVQLRPFPTASQKLGLLASRHFASIGPGSRIVVMEHHTPAFPDAFWTMNQRPFRGRRSLLSVGNRSRSH